MDWQVMARKKDVYRDALSNEKDDVDGIKDFDYRGGGTIAQFEDDLDLDLLEDVVKGVGYGVDRNRDSNGNEYLNPLGTPDIGVFGDGDTLLIDYGKRQTQTDLRIGIISDYLDRKYGGNQP